jgi:ATP-dependent DNA ligase
MNGSADCIGRLWLRPIVPRQLATTPRREYFNTMLSCHVRTDAFFDPCIPTLAAKPPSGPDWVHEVKHDGYRLSVHRDGAAVRLFTRRGFDAGIVSGPNGQRP